ncbi:MAG TPA: NAD(+)--rifampin ADP-ribosyltransferase [Saprospiraceae bacterium]|nr:NAD(+)--rifampin ADP-ribosyltransferase [Saprospiraceae bacterium]
MEFSPNNPIVQRCLQGMSLEESGHSDEANNSFMQAWKEATNDFEKFLAAHFMARQQKDVRDKLHWLETALQHALSINDVAVNSTLPSLYTKMSECYALLGNAAKAKKKQELAFSSAEKSFDPGPFFHGTKADLKVGDLLTAGATSNYNPNLTMNHIYFTALPNGAGLAAALAKGDGLERVYIVEPTGSFENDPNVTDKKFPGNLTRSYRSAHPLKIIGEVTDWNKQTPEDLYKWRTRLANNKGEIIN